MDRLWAPWRINYIRQKKKIKGCLLCKITKQRDKDGINLVFLRSKYSFAVLNKFPYNNGHIMVCPYAHKQNLEQLKAEEINDLVSLLIKTKLLLDKTLSGQGYNIGINIGAIAGAGIDKHLHIHIVPRWRGDTNFMPVASQTRVISQSLRELYNLLKKARHGKKRYK